MGIDTLMLWDALKLLGSFIIVCLVVIGAGNLWLWLMEKYGEDK